MAAIEMARGNTELAIKLTVESLDGQIGFGLESRRPPPLYHHTYCYEELAQRSAVAERLKELDAEAKKGGEEIWAYIVEHELQL